MKPRPIRLLITEPNSSTGTETVSLGIIPEILPLVECVVWAMPPHRIAFYKSLLPPTDRLIYEDLIWTHESRLFWQVFGLLQRMDLLLPQSRIIAWMCTRLTDSWLKHLIQKHRLTHYFTTWIFNVAIPKLPIPIGAMAMDLNWHQFPENFPGVRRQRLDRFFSTWLTGAEVVFPISDFTADQITRAFPKAAKRMKVVPHGARVFASAPAAGNPSQRPYFYYPASVFAHKDHQTAIEAAVALFDQGHDFELIFSGWRTETLLSRTADSNPLSESLRALLEKHSSTIKGRIKCLGIVDRAQVEALINGARALVLPSRFEGFGLPLLEAIERGAPVICTDIPPFLEQIRRYDSGDSTSVFPAGEANRLAALMEAALKLPAQPRPSLEEITARTQRWTWKDAAAAYVGALQEA